MDNHEIVAQEPGANPAPAFDAMTLTERAKYGLGVGLPVTFLLELMGTSGIGITLGVASILTAAYFGEEVRGVAQKVRGGSPVPTSRSKAGIVSEKLLNKEWWLHGNNALPMEKMTLAAEGDAAMGEVNTEPLKAANAPQQAVGSLFPEAPENEILQLGYVQATGLRFDPHFDKFFESGCFISAVQGSGKSVLVGRIVEEFGRCGGPCVVFDHKGEYWPITELPFIKGLRAGSASLAAKVGPDIFVLTPQTADAFVKKVKDERKQAIIHLPSYGDNWVERAEIVASVGLALMRHSMAERDAERVPLPTLVVMDEAQLYIPQDQGLLPAAAQKKENAEILDTLNNSYYAMVSNGRSNGYCVVFATQSPTYVKKWAIKSCQFKVYMRHSEFNDLNALEKVINPSVARREDIEVFGKGVGVAFGLTPRPVVVQFDMKQSRDLSDTPKVAQLRGANTQSVNTGIAQEPARVGDLTLEQLMALINQLPDRGDQEEEEKYSGGGDFPEEMQEEVKTPPAPVVPSKGLRADEVELTAAIHLWNAGYNSERKLMKAFPGLTLYQAGLLRDRILGQAGVQQENAVIE